MMNKEFDEDAQRFVESKSKVNDKNHGAIDHHLIELYSELFIELSKEPSVPDLNLADDVVHLLLVRESRKDTVCYYIYMVLIVMAGMTLFVIALTLLDYSLLNQLFQFFNVHAAVFIFVIACFLFIQAADKFLLNRKSNPI